MGGVGDAKSIGVDGRARRNGEDGVGPQSRAMST